MKKLLEYKGITPKVGRNVFIADTADVIGNVSLGDESNIWFQCVVRGDINTIEIGSRTNIQDGTIVHISFDSATVIGNNVTIGHAAIIHGCEIRDNVLIGMGACILDRSVIPKNCIVGAKSLVTKGKTFEEGSLIIGSPAKAVRKLTEDEIAGIKASADHYVDYSKEYMN